jgi:NADPH:quinone reductase-like Zn-dependent oxidoreductase
MKAVRIHQYGGPEVLRYEDSPQPQPRPDDLLVRVRAAGVNPADWKMREGMGRYMVDYTFPLVLGWDFSGVVEDMGAEVQGWNVGDEVYARPDLTRNGAYAQYIAVRASEVARKPASIDHLHAGGIALAALTAWQAIFDGLALSPGQRLLIHGAAGGVGCFAVQLAKWKGAHVIATASGRNREFLADLGADEVIDYTRAPFEQAMGQVDAVFDTVGLEEYWPRSCSVLRPGGAFITVAAAPAPEDAAARGVRVGRVGVRPNAAQLSQIAELVDTGRVRAPLERVLPLSEARRAQELSRAGHVRGKIVLDPAG